MVDAASVDGKYTDETGLYEYTENSLGVWRRHLHRDGRTFAEFTSHGRLFGVPLLHFTRGVSPETRKRVVARGVIAVGRVAVGMVAIGQAAFGMVAIGQLAIGILGGLGQGTTGVFALGQLALGVAVGVGQLTTGAICCGQLAFGWYALGQLGFGRYVWSTTREDGEAVEFFSGLLGL